jgi:hypothetical protein
VNNTLLFATMIYEITYAEFYQKITRKFETERDRKAAESYQQLSDLGVLCMHIRILLIDVSGSIRDIFLKRYF